MLSMTGYGKGEVRSAEVDLTVEVKSVNNRYLDISIKAPKIFAAYEDVLRSAIKEKLTRGHIDVFVSFTDHRAGKKNLTFDEGAAVAFLSVVHQMEERFLSVKNDVTLSTLLKNPDILKQEEEAGADEVLVSALKQALYAALDRLNGMRKIEGEKLKTDLLSRMDTIEELVGKIKERAPLVAQEYAVKITERVKAFLQGVQPDEGRLLTEIALFADKSNIDEEITRLYSHIAQFRSIAENELVGRKLDFLVQEFNRETNTICSKSNDLAITESGLALKNEIEKVREQVQNLE